MKKSFVLALIVLAVIIGIIVGRYSVHSGAAEKKPMYWIDTMEPTIHYPKPGTSRMGMELVPVYPDEGRLADKSGVRISPTVINNLGVRTALVTQGPLDRLIETVGYVEPNENKISHIHTYADGWVRKLFVKAVGETVKMDQPVLELYSPALVTVQEEYLIALGGHNQSLLEASEKRLEAFHIAPQQIQQLKTTRKASELIDIYPHQSGVITMLNVREGMHVTPDTEMMSIVDLSNIWIIAQVYEAESSWVKAGETAEARLSAFPGKVWKGVVEYVYPEVDPTTRTLKVRFRFDNPEGILKPNMYADISIFAEPKSDVLSIPLEALIRSSQGDRVIVSLGDGRFQIRPVTIGIESGNQVEILSGLQAGERVVASGQFLIDSEANLNASLERVEASTPSSEAPKKATGPWSNIVIQGKGVIKNINVAQNSLTLQHEPIPVLSWPEMVMDFSVDKGIDLNQFKLGDHVKFTLRKDKDNTYVITDMEKLTP